MDPQKTMQHILSHPDVIAVAPIFEETGLLLANGDMAGVAITGIDPEAEKKVSILDRFFVAGSMDRLGVDRFSMVLGPATGYTAFDRSWRYCDICIA